MNRVLIGCLVAVLLASAAHAANDCSSVASTVILGNGNSPGPVSVEIIDPYPVTATFSTPVLTASTTSGILVDQDVNETGGTTSSCNDASVTVPSVIDYLVVEWRYHITGPNGSTTRTFIKRLTFCNSGGGDAPPSCPPPAPNVPLFGPTAVLLVCASLAAAGALALRR
jgi:hypothetical protein